MLYYIQDCINNNRITKSLFNDKNIGFEFLRHEISGFSKFPLENYVFKEINDFYSSRSSFKDYLCNFFTSNSSEIIFSVASLLVIFAALMDTGTVEYWLKKFENISIKKYPNNIRLK